MSRLPILLGPTAVGKTAVALQLAGRLNAEIIGADSRQIYRGLDIGTAKPDLDARRRVPHHLIDFLDPGEHYSAGDFARDASGLIEEIEARGRRPLIVGGTGLYIRALAEGLTPGLGRNPTVRLKVKGLLERLGLKRLYEALIRLDPDSAKRIKPGDSQRITRALELFIIHRKPLKEIYSSSTKQPLETVKAGIRLPREVLYRRIEARVDGMIAAGLTDEVKKLLAAGVDPQSNAMTGLGYRECVRYLQGEIDLETAIGLIKRNSRRFAKRQETFFKKIGGINWLDIDESETPETIADRVLDVIVKT